MYPVRTSIPRKKNPYIDMVQNDIYPNIHKLHKLHNQCHMPSITCHVNFQHANISNMSTFSTCQHSQHVNFQHAACQIQICTFQVTFYFILGVQVTTYEAYIAYYFQCQNKVQL